MLINDRSIFVDKLDDRKIDTAEGIYILHCLWQVLSLNSKQQVLSKPYSYHDYSFCSCAPVCVQKSMNVPPTHAEIPPHVSITSMNTYASVQLDLPGSPANKVMY